MRFLNIFRKRTSSNIAKDRLKLLLLSDRANCSTELMELIKNDIVHVISKYIEIDEKGIEVSIETSFSGLHKKAAPALYASIPIKDMKIGN